MGIAGFLVFFMQAGFALVESGFTRSKNTVNILMKNLLDFCLGSMAFWAVGFGIMYGSSQGGFLGTGRWFLSDAVGADGSINNWEYMEWFFQVVFAATSATIVSGAMAERTNFKGYLIYSVVISALIYPIQGHWIWGGGFLAKLGFHDFAGSTVVHSVGGWAALMGAILLGPRLGKFDSKRNPRVIPGHSIPLAVTGVFILWLGWFGFNPGSTLGASTSFARIAVTTNLAACAGGLAAMFFAWAKVKKPDVGLTLNGVLAGLVAITAPCAVVSPGSAIIIGAIAGVLCTLFVDIMERTFKVDDPVGAFAVHGVNGVWGTLAVGLFAADPFASATGVKAGLLFGGGLAQLVSQAIGIGVVAVWTLATTGILFGVLKAAGLLRVSADEEMEGLDAGEHGTHAYHHDDQTGRSIAFAGEGD
ncbi:ammonium transporter [Candidatus Poribacteria bacterium]|nr:ammonium transporter [Candidatus Poribacteria bacterium]